MQDARWTALLSRGCSGACVATSEISLLSMQRLTFVVAFLAVLVLAAKPSTAQTWPQRTVKFIVTLGPGSGVDIGTRLIADRLSRRWGQPVVVENRPGGDGLVAISAFVGANDDHVLLAAPSGSFTAHPFIYKHLPYKAADIVPIARISNTIVVMAVPASLEVKSVAELVAMARAQPGTLNWAARPAATNFCSPHFSKMPVSRCQKFLIAIWSKQPTIWRSDASRST
jgi:tripartite-type tricarboxylate transporter receptor subunit TctC